MIDRDMLKQLGWSDSLIDEVTRTALPLRTISDKLPEVPDILQPKLQTCDTIILGPAAQVDSPWGSAIRAKAKHQA